MELHMPVTTEKQLMMFNTLALQIQDEAFTLAYYLLGDETRAGEAIQGAFARLYQRPGLKFASFRRDVFQRVLAQCRALSSGLRAARFSVMSARDEIIDHLLQLNESERSAAVLVDVLGLSYEEAADVLGCSKRETGRLLAQARFHLAHHPVAFSQ